MTYIRLLRPACAAIVVAAMLGLAAQALAQDYPRLGLYGSIRGDGTPFYTPQDSTLKDSVLDAVSRYHTLIYDINPISPYRPDILQKLRERHPGIKIFAYSLGSVIWPANDADSLHHFPTRYRHLVRDLDGFLYNRRGGEFSNSNVNLAKKDANGRYVVAEGLADLFFDGVFKTRLWDGLFLDIFCDYISWSQSPAESIDLARTGYSSYAELDANWHAASDTMANRMRRLMGRDFPLMGNCAVGTKYLSFNGWMRENFPWQQGGNWYENMFQDPGGYFLDDQRFRNPRFNWIFSMAAIINDPYAWENMRRVRFGLGSATLGDGYAVFANSDRDVYHANYHMWWYDEYAVQLTSGRSSTSIQDIGWLGPPQGAYYQMIWIGPNADAITNSEFEANVTAGWDFWHGVVPTATITRDTSNAASGLASAHISIPNATAMDWQVTLSSQGTVQLQPYTTFTATFWARASSPRAIAVIAANPAGGQWQARSVYVSTTWQRFQIAFIPTQSGPSKLQFYLGANVGDVWFDDVHFQQGASSVYRRDFQNGIVLVNPSDQDMTVPLYTPFRKILGIQNPALNDGSVVTSVTVSASDALFLLNNDVTPPADITDLHRVVR